MLVASIPCLLLHLIFFYKDKLCAHLCSIVEAVSKLNALQKRLFHIQHKTDFFHINRIGSFRKAFGILKQKLWVPLTFAPTY